MTTSRKIAAFSLTNPKTGVVTHYVAPSAYQAGGFDFPDGDRVRAVPRALQTGRSLEQWLSRVPAGDLTHDATGILTRAHQCHEFCQELYLLHDLAVQGVWLEEGRRQLHIQLKFSHIPQQEELDRLVRVHVAPLYAQVFTDGAFQPSLQFSASLPQCPSMAVDRASYQQSRHWSAPSVRPLAACIALLAVMGMTAEPVMAAEDKLAPVHVGGYVGPYGGAAKGGGMGGMSGSVVATRPDGYGAQLDMAYGKGGGDTYAYGKAYGFYRPPSGKGLVGVTASRDQVSGIHRHQVGVIGQRYDLIPDTTVAVEAGGEKIRGEKLDFYGSTTVRYYFDEDLFAEGTVGRSGGKAYFQAGVEKKFDVGRLRNLAFYTDGGVSSDGGYAMVGVRYYFGAKSSLKRKDQHQYIFDGHNPMLAQQRLKAIARNQIADVAGY